MKNIESPSGQNPDYPKFVDARGNDVTVEVMGLLASADENGYIRAGELFSIFNMQTQYGSYLFRNMPGHVYIGEGVRYEKSDFNYHQDKIHKDDVPLAAQRLSEYLQNRF